MQLSSVMQSSSVTVAVFCRLLVKRKCYETAAVAAAAAASSLNPRRSSLRLFSSFFCFFFLLFFSLTFRWVGG